MNKQIINIQTLGTEKHANELYSFIPIPPPFHYFHFIIMEVTQYLLNYFILFISAGNLMTIILPCLHSRPYLAPLPKLCHCLSEKYNFHGHLVSLLHFAPQPP